MHRQRPSKRTKARKGWRPVGKPTGFTEFDRETLPWRLPLARLADFDEVYTDPAADEEHLRRQAARCMDCGVPFCQSPDLAIGRSGCPIHNLIPEWNDLVWHGDWREALDRLHKTNNFPEFTGRVCPAPCEESCVLGISDPAVTIKNIELAIIERGFAEGWVQARPPRVRSGRRVVIIGSGPAGLAAAAQLNQAGHSVEVHEREDRVGGLLMYGIPNMKLDKQEVVERRIALMREEGIEIITGSNVGNGQDGTYPIDRLVAESDALLLTTGATVPRDLPIPGRDLEGVHFAMDFLTENTRSLLNPNVANDRFIDAKDRRVIVIGGGDTGADCIGTSLRHGCRSLVNFELFPLPPAVRDQTNPWPTWAHIFRVDYAHQEAQAKFDEDPRVYSISTTEFIGDEKGVLTGLKTVDMEPDGSGRMQAVAGSERKWEADLVFLAMGYLGPEHAVSEPLGIELDDRSNYRAIKGEYRTSLPKVFAAGDCRSGQSLVVRAINEGREAAREIDRFLSGKTQLP